MSTAKTLTSPQSYEQLRTAIRCCFPDPTSPLAEVTDAMVDTFIESAWTDGNLDANQRARLGIPAPPPGFVVRSAPSAQEDAAVVGYYNARSTHRRTRNGAAWDEFTGDLPLVRVRLAKSDRSQITTAIGVVDHTTSLFVTVDELNQRLANEPGFRRAGAVELITPPRKDGERFAAVGVYLCYALEGDTVPQAYLLEAGLAQGGPRVPFYGETLDTVIVAQTNYEPTVFSRASHWYRGSLGFAAEEPTVLHIEVFKDRDLTQKYMDVRVAYDRATAQTVSKTNPFFIRAEAVLRVMAIAQSIGLNAGLPELLQSVLAGAGHALPWHKRPPA